MVKMRLLKAIEERLYAELAGSVASDLLARVFIVQLQRLSVAAVLGSEFRIYDMSKRHTKPEDKDAYDYDADTVVSIIDDVLNMMLSRLQVVIPEWEPIKARVLEEYGQAIVTALVEETGSDEVIALLPQEIARLRGDKS